MSFRQLNVTFLVIGNYKQFLFSKRETALVVGN